MCRSLGTGRPLTLEIDEYGQFDCTVLTEDMVSEVVGFSNYNRNCNQSAVSCIVSASEFQVFCRDTQGLPCSLGSIPVVWSGFIGRQSCLGDRRNMVIRNDMVSEVVGFSNYNRNCNQSAVSCIVSASEFQVFCRDTQGLPCSLGSIPVVWSGFIGRQSCLGDRRNMVIRNGELYLGHAGRGDPGMDSATMHVNSMTMSNNCLEVNTFSGTLYLRHAGRGDPGMDSATMHVNSITMSNNCLEVNTFSGELYLRHAGCGDLGMDSATMHVNTMTMSANCLEVNTFSGELYLRHAGRGDPGMDSATMHVNSMTMSNNCLEVNTFSGELYLRHAGRGDPGMDSATMHVNSMTMSNNCLEVNTFSGELYLRHAGRGDPGMDSATMYVNSMTMSNSCLEVNTFSGELYLRHAGRGDPGMDSATMHVNTMTMSANCLEVNTFSGELYLRHAGRGDPDMDSATMHVNSMTMSANRFDINRFMATCCVPLGCEISGNSILGNSILGNEHAIVELVELDLRHTGCGDLAIGSMTANMDNMIMSANRFDVNGSTCCVTLTGCEISGNSILGNEQAFADLLRHTGSGSLAIDSMTTNMDSVAMSVNSLEGNTCRSPVCDRQESSNDLVSRPSEDFIREHWVNLKLYVSPVPIGNIMYHLKYISGCDWREIQDLTRSTAIFHLLSLIVRGPLDMCMAFACILTSNYAASCGILKSIGKSIIERIINCKPEMAGIVQSLDCLITSQCEGMISASAQQLVDVDVMATEGCSTGHTGGSGFVQPYGLSYAIKDDEGRRREVEEFKEVLADQLVYKDRFKVSGFPISAPISKRDLIVFIRNDLIIFISMSKMLRYNIKTGVEELVKLPFILYKLFECQGVSYGIVEDHSVKKTSIQAYDVEANTWKYIRDFSGASNLSRITVDEHSIYGMITYGDQNCQKVVDRVTQTEGFQRGFHVSAADENTTNCISCYNLPSGTWTPSIPVGHGHCDFTVMESVAYVAYEDGRIEAISLSESGKPSKLLPSLPGRLPCKVFTNHHHLFAIGKSSCTIYVFYEALNQSEAKWMPLVDLPVELQGLETCIINDSTLAIAGIDNHSGAGAVCMVSWAIHPSD
ncbi:uncharacterized protein LOC134177752 isoform X3 [Corticium candelabrum]|uniref:uncharacterized protein LOC134177752 isoform X3 n=1 Tax=Corticium candelabrum TaxID=121492 RepID=UPI002E2735D9|nr:uncharacterized protein LOC134177752 isoform X3 [Corticium candelabrum]